MSMILFANAIGAEMGFVPGFAPFGPILGLPIAILAAVIERPFVARAGFPKRSIWFSLQANFVSLVFGALCVMCVLHYSEAFFLFWPPVAVLISIVAERWYLNLRLRGGRVPWAPIALGNIISSAVCIGVLFAALYLRKAFPILPERLRSYEVDMNRIVAIGSLIVLACSFFVLKPRQKSISATESEAAAGAVDRVNPQG